MIPVSPCSARLSSKGKVGQLHIHSGFLPIPAKFLPPPSFVPKEMGLGEDGRREGGHCEDLQNRSEGVSASHAGSDENFFANLRGTLPPSIVQVYAVTVYPNLQPLASQK